MAIISLKKSLNQSFLIRIISDRIPRHDNLRSSIAVSVGSVFSISYHSNLSLIPHHLNVESSVLLLVFFFLAKEEIPRRVTLGSWGNMLHHSRSVSVTIDWHCAEPCRRLYYSLHSMVLPSSNTTSQTVHHHRWCCPSMLMNLCLLIPSGKNWSFCSVTNISSILLLLPRFQICLLQCTAFVDVLLYPLNTMTASPYLTGGNYYED